MKETKQEKFRRNKLERELVRREYHLEYQRKKKERNNIIQYNNPASHVGFFTASLADNKRLQAGTCAMYGRDGGAVPEAWEKSQKIGGSFGDWQGGQVKKMGFFLGKLFVKPQVISILQISNIFFVSLHSRVVATFKNIYKLQH